jgi:hypothetical protein
MYRYKTLVTDYEGMQEALSTYGEQGWKLLSANPDTWRLVTEKIAEEGALGMVSPEVGSMHEISASYYLLVFQMDDDPVHTATHEAAAEVMDYPEFSLPDY